MSQKSLTHISLPSRLGFFSWIRYSVLMEERWLLYYDDSTEGHMFVVLAAIGRMLSERDMYQTFHGRILEQV